MSCHDETKPSTEKSEVRTNLHGKQDEIKKEDMDVEDGTERMELKEAEGSKKEERRKPLPLEGLRFLASGLFPKITEGPDPQWGPASNLYNGRNVLKRLDIPQGGQFTLNINKQMKFLIVGLKPSKKRIKKARLVNADIISYTTLEGMIARTVAPEFTNFEPQPDLGEYSQGTNPPKILHNRTFSSVEPPPEAEETATAKVSFTGVKIRKCKEVSTPEGTPECPNLVAGSELLGKKRILDVSHLRKNKCKYVSVVHATMWVPHGGVKNLVMDLMFMGLDTLRAEDKSVCFLHPNDPNQRAKARKDMPAKFQKIHMDWMVFNQPIGQFKNDIKEGRTRTYNVSLWLGSELPAKKILEQCTLEWEETRSNGSTIKMVYKRDQSLYTARNLIVVGVPTDLDADPLQLVLKDKMEEARKKMVAKTHTNMALSPRYCSLY